MARPRPFAWIGAALTAAGLACNLGAATPGAVGDAPTALPTELQSVSSATAPADQAGPIVPSPVIASGNVYYVATDGDDGQAGTLEQPWRTLQHAADAANPGDTIIVRGGTYSEEVTLRRSGRPGAPITFLAQPDEQATLDGGGAINSAFATDFSEPDPHVSDITISGFTIQNYASFGFVAWSVNDRLTLTELVVQNNRGTGIRFSNSDGSKVQRVLLRNNEGGFDCTPVLPGAAAVTLPPLAIITLTGR